MNTKNYKFVGIVIAIVLLYGAYISFKDTPTIKVSNKTFDPRNTTYTINNQSFTLKNGISEIAAPNSSSKIITRYFGNEATGDLTGDNIPDLAYLITQETGGSGIFYYAVVAINNGGTYTLTNPFFIGDRIAPQPTEIKNMELYVIYAERKQGEPMTARPSVGAMTLLKVTKDGVLEGLMK